MSDREAIGRAARRGRPASTKRTAPKQEKTPEQKQAAEARHGVAKSYRLSKSTVDAVAAAAAEHDLKLGEFVEFCLRASLIAISNGNLKVPVEPRKVAGQQISELPGIPRGYRG